MVGKYYKLIKSVYNSAGMYFPEGMIFYCKHKDFIYYHMEAIDTKTIDLLVPIDSLYDNFVLTNFLAK